MTARKPKELHKKPGRPCWQYDPNLPDRLIRFFDVERVIWRDITITNKDGSTVEKSEEEAGELPLFGDFIKKEGISHGIWQQLINEENKEKFPGFMDAYNTAKDLQRDHLLINGLRGNYQGYFGVMAMKNMFEWRDKKEFTGAEGGPFAVKITYEDN